MSNGQEDDEIKKLPLKERLECQKIQAEIARSEEEKKKIELEREGLERKSKSHLYKNRHIYQALIAGFILVPLIWFYIHDIALPLSSRENIKLSKELMERNQELNEERKELDEMILQHAKLQDQKIQLEEDIETFKLDISLLEEKYMKGLKDYTTKTEMLKQEYTKLKEEVESVSSFTNWYSRGAGELLDNKPEEAIASFEKALETKPNKLSAAYTHSYIGRAYFKLSNYPASFASFKEAFELYITLNELDHALRCFNEMRIVLKEVDIDAKKSFKDDIDQLQEQLIEAKNKEITK